MPTAADLLDRYPSNIQALTEELRALVRATVPEAQESVRLGWQSLGYRRPRAGYFFGLFPKHDHVQALFEWGALLTDEEHPLEGSGAQVRYVAVRTLDEPTRTMLIWGLRAALALPPGRDAKLAMLTAK
jgi:hypothetical protein